MGFYLTRNYVLEGLNHELWKRLKRLRRKSKKVGAEVEAEVEAEVNLHEEALHAEAHPEDMNLHEEAHPEDTNLHAEAHLQKRAKQAVIIIIHWTKNWTFWLIKLAMACGLGMIS